MRMGVSMSMSVLVLVWWLVECVNPLHVGRLGA